MEFMCAMVRIGEPSSCLDHLKEAQLVEMGVSGDAEALEELARRCLPRIRRTVYLMTCTNKSGASADADDLVQTAIIRVFDRMASIRKLSSFMAWVDRTTVNTVREYYRRRPLYLLFRSSAETTEMAADQAPDPQCQCEGRQSFEQLTALLSGIRPKKRIALVLSLAYGYSCAEIAQLTGCSAETAKKRVQHGRKEMLARARKNKCLSSRIQEPVR